MNREILLIIESLDNSQLNVLEISGNNWANYPFKSYTSWHFPEFDICAELPDIHHKKYDLIIVEQVFEHLAYPQVAVRNIYKILKKNGYFLISTPFLIRRHDFPIDCTRWTALGLNFFLIEAGFEALNIKTNSWGNKSCLIANLDIWVIYNKYLHTLKNEPKFPVVVWGLAQK